jgi:multidrug resistance protein
MLSMSIFPLWWSSFSEILGRRTIYLSSFVLFTVFNIISAVAKSISMLIVFRLLSGGAAASVQAVGAGTIADIWDVRERGKAMGIFYLGPLCGPLFAPIIGGILAQRWDWRATLWFLVIYGLVTFVFIVFALPETLKSRRGVNEEGEKQATEGEGLQQLGRVSTREKVQKRTKNWLNVLKIVLLDPLKIILFLRFPAVLLTVFYASITFGSLYALNISLQESFERSPYNFSTIILGLLYIPNSLGYIVASLFGGRWMDYIMAREAKKAGRYDEKGKLVYQPEDRMRENAWLGAFVYPAALVWYGWSVEKGVHWIVPVSALFALRTRGIC